MRDDEETRTRGAVYWVTGLAGAGKTTVGRELVGRLRARGRTVAFLDGDTLREALFPDAGYAPADRLALARQYSRLCGWLSGQGFDVVCATISLFPEIWTSNRSNLSAYREILLEAPAEVLASRRRSLYDARSESDHVVGRDEPAPLPPHPDVRLRNDGGRTPAELVDDLLSQLSARDSRPRSKQRAPLNFGSKAETLELLESRVRTARILPQVRFTLAEWRTAPESVLYRIRAHAWSQAPVIVRSSALDEDALDTSLAGRFRSIGDCLGDEAIQAAVEEVVASLAGRSDADQVFVQPQLTRIYMGGVLLTRDPNSGSHSTVISYDVTSGRADRITSGLAENRRTYVRHEATSAAPPAELAGPLDLARELHELFCNDALDIEFAVATDGTLYLLQVRPLSLPPEDPGPERLDAAGEATALARIADRVAELGRPHPYLYGTRAVFGTMPDWNPAEVIGVRPKPLAFSLYKELVTDSIWAYQRSNYGYRNLRSFPLLVSLCGLPYVDVRASFNSFLPAGLDADLGRRLVDHYTHRLLESPIDHDKVEFAIVHSGYTLDLPDRLAGLRESGFTHEDCEQLAASLRTLTNRITADPDALYRADLAKIRELEHRQTVFARGAGDLDLVSRIYWILEDCKRYGTLPFAGIARAAFIAVQLLDSLVATGILSREEREQFLRSVDSVLGRMNVDLARLPREAFLREYGHLRPGTYDVTSPRYDEAPEAYFEGTGPPPVNGPVPALELSTGQRRRIDESLASHGLTHDAESLITFLRAAIEGREYAKFVFTRSLSDALVLLVELAAEHGISREELAFADIDIVRQLYASNDDPRAVLEASVNAGRRRFEVTRRITLPPIITSPEDAFAFHLPDCEPNFVTLGHATGPVVTPEGQGPEHRNGNLRGSIVLIPSADPGHDWIFSHSVAGFITMYGGYNSHMAIRACELGIPAVIGAGEHLFRTWASARRLHVDCLNRKVEVLA